MFFKERKITKYTLYIWAITIASSVSSYGSSDTVAAEAMDPSSQAACVESQPATQARDTEYTPKGPCFPSAPPSSLATTVSVHLTPSTLADRTSSLPSQDHGIDRDQSLPSAVLPGNYGNWAPETNPADQ
jgi:hypothetical protein